MNHGQHWIERILKKQLLPFFVFCCVLVAFVHSDGVSHIFTIDFTDTFHHQLIIRAGEMWP
jgi:hypothetical protein